MNRQQEALAQAEVLMADIELSQTSTAKHVLKAIALARFRRDDVAQQWLGSRSTASRAHLKASSG